MKDCFVQDWTSSVNCGTDRRLYKYVKTEFKYEQYLSEIHCQKFRIALTKIRLSSHSLLIERGRWLNMPIEKRLCTNCFSLDDEYHCLIECKRFSHIQMKYLPKCLKKYPSFVKFIDMFKDSKNQFRVAVLCYKVISLYNKIAVQRDL